MNVADTISEIVRRASTEPEDERTHEVLKGIRALPGIEELSGPLTFRTGPFEIQVGMTQHLEKAVNSLNEVRPLKLSIAPEVVSHLPFSDNESVLVTRYPAVEGEKLVALKPGQGVVSDGTRARVRADFEKLAANGMVHGYASRGFAHWLSTADKKTVVLDGWTSLRPAGVPESAQHLEQIDGLLSRLA
jgi:hypothetical protein